MSTLRADRRGAALVEFAIVAILLLVLVFGIIEFGLLIRDYLAINHAAREGARSAAFGSPTSVVLARVQNTLSSITVRNDQIALLKTTSPDPSSGWVPLGDSGGFNDAQDGNLVQVRVSYDHQLISGGLFNNGAPIRLTAKMIMRRER